MEAPHRIEPKGLADYLDALSKPVFQSGISWRVVEVKWPGTREAFLEFDPEAVANMTPTEMDALAADTQVIRNRRKLEAVVKNAHRILELEERHGGFRRYLRSHWGFEETVADLRKQFRFIGDMGAFHFLYVVGEDVPSYEGWCVSRGRTPQSA